MLVVVWANRIILSSFGEQMQTGEQSVAFPAVS